MDRFIGGGGTFAGSATAGGGATGASARASNETAKGADAREASTDWCCSWTAVGASYGAGAARRRQRAVVAEEVATTDGPSRASRPRRRASLMVLGAARARAAGSKRQSEKKYKFRQKFPCPLGRGQSRDKECMLGVESTTFLCPELVAALEWMIGVTIWRGICFVFVPEAERERQVCWPLLG